MEKDRVVFDMKFFKHEGYVAEVRIEMDVEELEDGHGNTLRVAPVHAVPHVVAVIRDAEGKIVDEGFDMMHDDPGLRDALEELIAKYSNDEGGIDV